MGEGLDEEAAGAGGGIEHRLAKARIAHGDHQPDDGARGIEFAGVARGIAHLAEHGLVERAEGVQLIGGGEVDAGHFVHHIAQEVAALHAVIDALENGGDHVAPVVAVRAGELAQVGE